MAFHHRVYGRIRRLSHVALRKRARPFTTEELRQLLEPQAPLNNRVTLLNYLVARFHYRKYLEIGCKENQTFDRIAAPYRVGVDPARGGTMRMTSDAYFELSDDRFDLILIDGLHQGDQVFHDIRNALDHLHDGGTIVLHDCNPATEERQTRAYQRGVWNGDVWKGFVHYRQDPGLDIITGNFDHGLGIIRVRPNPAPIELPKPYGALTWAELTGHRPEWLRLCSAEQVKAWL